MKIIIALWLILAAGTCSLLSARAADGAEVRTIGVAEFEKMRADTNSVVLDVRTPREFAGGHVPGATNLPISAPDFEKRLESLDRNRPYLVHCAVGVRSGKAVRQMKKMGFKQIFDFSGGWTAWKEAGKPVEK